MPLTKRLDEKLRRLFTVERATDDGEIVVPAGLRRLASRLNQALVEHGRASRWALSQAEAQAYWAGRDTASDANNPADIAAKDARIVDFLASFWGPEVSPADRVLELGPNAGPNLNRLYRLGYHSLSGVDINPNAIAQMRSAFPELAATASISIGPFEQVLPTFEPDSVDAVFTVAVLMHVHPASKAIFPEIVRVAARHVCVIELEHASSSYVYPRDYRRVFGRLGCTEVRSLLITPESAPDVSRDYDGYVARLFRTP